MQIIERTINAERVEQLIDVFGSFDENLKRIEAACAVRITNRGNELKIQGEEEAADQGARALESLLALAAKGEEIDEQKVRYILSLVRTGNEAEVANIARDVVCVSAKGRPIKAKTIGQQKYLKAIEKNTVTIGVGPAGTGKTYLAVAEAVAAFRAKSGIISYCKYIAITVIFECDHIFFFPDCIFFLIIDLDLIRAKI